METEILAIGRGVFEVGILEENGRNPCLAAFKVGIK